MYYHPWLKDLNISWLNIYEKFEYEFKLPNMSTENQNTSE